MKVIKVDTPATTANLGPGFDVFGAALDLFNEVEIYPGHKFSVEIYGEGSSTLPRGDDNLVVNSFRKTCRFLGTKPPSARFVIKNRIPVSRGLGSSSSAIVAGVTAAFVYCGKEPSDEQIVRLSARIEGHPDNVVPAYYGGIRLCYLTDEGVKSVALKVPEKVSVVLVVPKQRISTARARKVLQKKVSLSDAVFNISRAALLVHALETGKLSLLKEATADRLHQDRRLKLIERGEELMRSIISSEDCIAGWLSGAGSSMAFLVEEKKTADFAAHCEKVLDSLFLEGRVISTSFSPVGAKVEFEQ